MIDCTSKEIFSFKTVDHNYVVYDLDPNNYGCRGPQYGLRVDGKTIGYKESFSEIINFLILLAETFDWFSEDSLNEALANYRRNNRGGI